MKNDVHLSLSHGQPIVLVLLDFSAVFNTTDHNNLHDCLKSWFGVCSIALKWFTSYLSHRFQAVLIGSTHCELNELMLGIP